MRALAIIASAGLIPAMADQSSVPGAYFDLKPPAITPELFAPGIVNVPGRSAGRIAFSSDATECAFTVFEGAYTHNRILFTRYENGAWTQPRPLAGIEGREMLEPLFSRDNRQLYVTVKSPNNQSAVDFWEIARTPDGWGKPQPMPAPFNSPVRDFCLAQTADGTMYFASDREGGHGGLDLYRTVQKSGQPLEAENLGLPINSATEDGDPAPSPDGGMLVFYSEANRPRHTGQSDLFICFANGKGGWTRPVNMGEGFNTPVQEYGATFSQDGRVFFFVRFDGKKGEVYWVDARSLGRFRQQSEAAANEPEPPPPPERKSINVPAGTLQRYVGTYTAPELTCQVTLEGDQLMIQPAGQPKFPLFAESETHFFLKVAEVDFEFVPNEREEINQLVLHQNGAEVKMARKPVSNSEPKS